MSRRGVSNLLGLAGAIVGGALGVLASWWIASQGFYAPVVPGVFVGLGCLLLAQHTSTARGITCGVIAMGVGLLAEWVVFPFRADDSLGYFLAHLTELRPLTWILLGVGAVIAFWVGRDHAFGRGLERRGPKPTAGQDEL